MLEMPSIEETQPSAATLPEFVAQRYDAYDLRISFPAALVPRMLESVQSKLGPNAKYGLGVIVRPTPLGPTWGHSGFFPGYATEMMYFPELNMSAAVQVNTSAPYPGGLPAVLQAAVRALR